MDGDGGILCSIGELARRTGLTVKTVRFYSDRGIVTPAERTPAGYRRYGPDAVARLALVRTLRELGLGLDVIRQVVDRELTLGDVAAQHAAALDVQIGVLRLRRAVLTAVAKRGHTPEETARMHRLARLTEDERRRLTDDFLTGVFTDLDGGDVHAGVRRSLTPELPDDPTDEQVEAWAELAELMLDPGFRASLRRAVEDQARHVSDVIGLQDLLAADASVVGDGGGKAPQLARAVMGARNVARLFASVFPRMARVDVTFEQHEVNGQPGAIFRDRDGKVLQALTLDVLDGRIRTIRVVINPDKLAHMGPVGNAWAVAREVKQASRPS
ncbi:MerR family transcriptional regulator [Streptomyces sp. NPDC050121]|uniref:MerR family transcriptional regulator n=1 Tax=Streptomyces sp. NPDC050121 TaxID=3365601 RepID=UPI00379166EA